MRKEKTLRQGAFKGLLEVLVTSLERGQLGVRDKGKHGSEVRFSVKVLRVSDTPGFVVIDERNRLKTGSSTGVQVLCRVPFLLRLC